MKSTSWIYIFSSSASDRNIFPFVFARPETVKTTFLGADNSNCVGWAGRIIGTRFDYTSWLHPLRVSISFEISPTRLSKIRSPEDNIQYLYWAHYSCSTAMSDNVHRNYSKPRATLISYHSCSKITPNETYVISTLRIHQHVAYSLERARFWRQTD